MSTAFICEGIRTPIGRYGGALSQVRTDDLAAIPLRTLREQFGQKRLGNRWMKFFSVARISRGKITATWRGWHRCLPAFPILYPGQR